jgi:hypothetical protein
VASKHLIFKTGTTGGTEIWFDRDGTGTLAAARITTLDGVAPTTLATQADWWFA